MSNDTSEAQHITALANARGVTPILSTYDVPGELCEKTEIQAFMSRHDGRVCVLVDGSVLTFNPDDPAVASAEQLSTLVGLTPVVRPTLQRVVRAMVEGTQDADPAPESDKSRTQLQALLSELESVALVKNATDIHIEIRQDRPARVRMRIDGLLRDYDTITYTDAMALGSLLFTSESDKGSGFSLTLPLQGNVVHWINGERIPIRLAVIPEARGGDILMRLEITGHKGLSLTELGLEDGAVDTLARAIKSPHGLILFSGPVGAGKSTLMRGLVRTLPDTLKVTFLEDPVEDTLDNATHVQLDEKVEATSMTQMQRAVTRWDGDVNVLGEIRDPASVAAVQTLVLLGRRVLATLHAVSVLAIPARLAHLGLDRAMLAEPGFLRALVNQRLLPQLCDDCALPASTAPMGPDDLARWQSRVGEESNLRLANRAGCVHCDHTGFKGRVLVTEHLTVTDTDRQYIASGDSLGWQNNLRERGWQNIAVPTLQQVRAGRVAPDVAEQLVGLQAPGD